MINPKRPPCWLVVLIYVILLALVSWLIVRFDLPDSMLLIFLVPCVLLAFFYNWRVYLSMILSVTAAGTWVTYQVSENFATSAITIVVAALSGLTMAVLVRKIILDRETAEKALRESEANFRTFFETITDIVVVGTTEGRLLFANSAASTILGYSPQELIGMHILDLHPADQRPEAQGILAAMFRGERDTCPLPLARQDGTLVPVETRIWMGRWNGIDCVFGVSKNLTAEQEAQQRFEHLFRNNPALMALSTVPDRHFFDVNNAFLETTGYSRSEIIGKTSAGLGLVVQTQQHGAAMERLLAQGQISNLELQICCKDGTYRDGLFWGVLISSQGQEYFLTVMLDITERKQAEDLLRVQRDLGMALGTAHGLDEILCSYMAHILQASEMDCGGVYIIDEDTGSIDLAYHTGFSHSFVERASHHAPDSSCGQMIMAGKPVYSQCSNRHVVSGHIECQDDLCASAIIPIRYEGQVVACLYVASHTRDDVPDLARSMLEAIAPQIGSAVVRAGAEEALRKNQALLDLFFSQSLDGFFFMMLDEPVQWDGTVDKEQVLDYVFAHQHITRANEAMLAQYKMSREQLLGRTPGDFFAHDIHYGRKVWRDFFDAGHLHLDTDERTFDGTPVCIEGDYVCLYDAQGWITGHFGVQREVTEQRQIVQEVRDHERFLSTLNDITRAALESPDMEMMLQTLADRMGELFSADGCYLTLWDQETQTTIGGAAYGAWRERYRRLQSQPGEPTMTAAVLGNGRPLAVTDVYDTPYMSRRIAELFPDHSLLGLPLAAGDRKLGAALIAYNEPHEFTPSEIACGEQAAGHIALALAKAQALQVERAQRARAEALNDVIARAVTASDLPTLLDSVLDRMLDALNLAAGAIWMLPHPADDAPPCMIVRNLPSSVAGIARVAQGAGLEAPRLLAVSDWQQMAHDRPEWMPVAEAMRQLGIASSLILPMRDEGHQRGGAALTASQPRHWTPEEIALVQAVGRQVDAASQRLRLEQELRESEERHRIVSQLTSDFAAAYRFGPDGHDTLEWLSGAFEHITGYTREQMEALDGVASIVHPEDAYILFEQRQAIREGRSVEGTFRIVTREGDVRWLHGYSYADLDQLDNRAQGYYIAVQDITDSKRAEEALLRASRLEATATLAGGIAHDLNNLMVGVRGYAELLKSELEGQVDDSLWPDASTMLDMISESAQQAGVLAQQVLAFARGGKYQPRIIDLAHTIQQVVSTWRRTLPGRIQLDQDTASNLWPVHADRAQISQVALNLLTNAAEAIEESGRIVVTTFNHVVTESQASKGNDKCPHLKPGNYVCFSVQDTGCGMSERVQARIFEPFFTTKFQGRGMGLAAAYGIVDNHGGCISVSSQEGEGSTLKVWLPAFAESVTGHPSPAPQDTAMVSTPAATILVAVDDTSVRQLIVRVVRRLGCDVLEAHNGLEAVDIARTYDNEIHLAILDMGMPGLSGPETYPFLVEVRPEIKVILCSGYEMDETTQALLNAGASGFVSKPFQMSALEQEIRKVLTNRGQN